MLEEDSSKQVAWLEAEVGGPKYLYKRDNGNATWNRAHPSTHDNQGREAEYALFQALRRKGYCLVNKEGGPILDEKGQVIDNTPLAPSKLSVSMEAIEEAISKLTTLDIASIPEGEVPSSRLLTLAQRMSLIKLNEHLEKLPREVLIGHTLQAAMRVQTGSTKQPVDVSLPDWLQPSMEVGDAQYLGTITVQLSMASKETLLDLLRQLLPEVARLEGLRGAVPAPDRREGAA